MAAPTGNVPDADMGSQASNESIDQELAADIESNSIQSVYSKVAPKLQMYCDIYHKHIMDAWGTIQAHMIAFDNEKKKIFATVHSSEKRGRADRIIQRGLDRMQPAAYDEIRKSIAALPTASQPSPQPSPIAARAQLATQDEDGDRPLFVRQEPRSSKPAPSAGPPKSPPKPTSSETGRGLGLSAKRSAHYANIYDGPASSTPSKKAKTTDHPATATSTAVSSPSGLLSPRSPSKAREPKYPDLYDFEVEGQDFIFAEPSFGPGYYVLRCNHHDGKIVGINKPRRFTTHPWDCEEVTGHFNGTDRSVRCHDPNRRYTREQIMCEFSQRVVGEDVNEAWVGQSNKRLQGNAGPKQSTRGAGTPGKGKGKAIDLGPARR